MYASCTQLLVPVKCRRMLSPGAVAAATAPQPGTAVLYCGPMPVTASELASYAPLAAALAAVEDGKHTSTVRTDVTVRAAAEDGDYTVPAV